MRSSRSRHSLILPTRTPLSDLAAASLPLRSSCSFATYPGSRTLSQYSHRPPRRSALRRPSFSVSISLSFAPIPVRCSPMSASTDDDSSSPDRMPDSIDAMASCTASYSLPPSFSPRFDMAAAHPSASDLLACISRSVPSTMSSSPARSSTVRPVGFAGLPRFWSSFSIPLISALSSRMPSMIFLSDSFLSAISLSVWAASARTRMTSFICFSMPDWRDSVSASLPARSSLARSNPTRFRSRERISSVRAPRSARYSSSLANLPASSSFLRDMCARSVSALSAAVL